MGYNVMYCLLPILVRWKCLVLKIGQSIESGYLLKKRSKLQVSFFMVNDIQLFFFLADNIFVES